LSTKSSKRFTSEKTSLKLHQLGTTAIIGDRPRVRPAHVNSHYHASTALAKLSSCFVTTVPRHCDTSSTRCGGFATL